MLRFLLNTQPEQKLFLFIGMFKLCAIGFVSSPLTVSHFIYIIFVILSVRLN